MTTYAIAAATGRYGRAALAQLLTKVGSDDVVIALARNVEKARAVVPQGVEVRAGDYSDADQMVEALKGVDRLLFVSSQPGAAVPRTQQHQNVIDAAVKDGVSLLAYTSFAKADTTTAPLAEDHQYTEAALKKSGLGYAFLRNAWYFENDAAVFKAAAAGKPLTYSAGDGRVSWAAEDDYAVAGANVLTSTQPKAVYEFGGTPRSFADVAAVVEEVTGRPVTLNPVDDATYEKGLEASGMKAGLAQLLTGFQTMMRGGALDVDSPDLAQALGRPVTPLAEALRHAIA